MSNRDMGAAAFEGERMSSLFGGRRNIDKKIHSTKTFYAAIPFDEKLQGMFHMTRASGTS